MEVKEVRTDAQKSSRCTNADSLQKTESLGVVLPDGPATKEQKSSSNWPISELLKLLIFGKDEMCFIWWLPLFVTNVLCEEKSYSMVGPKEGLFTIYLIRLSPP